MNHLPQLSHYIPQFCFPGEQSAHTDDGEDDRSEDNSQSESTDVTDASAGESPRDSRRKLSPDHIDVQSVSPVWDFTIYQYLSMVKKKSCLVRIRNLLHEFGKLD